MAVRLSTSSRRHPGPGFPLVENKPPTVAICGQVTTLPENTLVEQVGALSPAQMRAIAIGLLEVTQLHRLPGWQHPEIAARVGGRRRR